MPDNSKKIDDTDVHQAKENGDESENFDDSIWDEIIEDDFVAPEDDSKECDHFERLTNSKLSDSLPTEEIVLHKKFISIGHHH